MANKRKVSSTNWFSRFLIPISFFFIIYNTTVSLKMCQPSKAYFCTSILLIFIDISDTYVAIDIIFWFSHEDSEVVASTFANCKQNIFLLSWISTIRASRDYLRYCKC
jgi:hypothetical protein